MREMAPNDCNSLRIFLKHMRSCTREIAPNDHNSVGKTWDPVDGLAVRRAHPVRETRVGSWLSSVERYWWLKHWYSIGYRARRFGVTRPALGLVGPV